ncbi:Cation/H+ exchanger [Cunninghamella echinulata]|nr:Cation/H+ exchanger [Cunninghamella echinulata]
MTSIDDTVSMISTILGGFILLFGLCSLAIKEKYYMSEAFVALGFGILFSPSFLNIINIISWEYELDFTSQFTRIVIAIQVMAAGIMLPKAYLKTEFTSLIILLGPVMIWMWMISGVCVKYVFPDFSYLEALIIASCFAPTDPVLANSIVQGHFAEKYVPTKIRHIISAESGANDGLGYPFLFLAIYLCQYSTSTALAKWTFSIMIYNIGFSVVIGFLAGHVARKLLKFAQQRNLIDHESFLGFAISFTFFLMGSVSLIGCDDLLACFIAGNSFTWDDWFKNETENSHIMDPWSSFMDESNGITLSKLILLAILVLLFRRIPIIIALYKWIPSIDNFQQAVFTGHFGPIGVGAIFYYTVATQYLKNLPHSDTSFNPLLFKYIEPIIYFMVLSSVIVHGITIPIFRISSIATRTLSRTRTSNNDNSQSFLVSAYG